MYIHIFRINLHFFKEIANQLFYNLLNKGKNVFPQLNSIINNGH